MVDPERQRERETEREREREGVKMSTLFGSALTFFGGW